MIGIIVTLTLYSWVMTVAALVHYCKDQNVTINPAILLFLGMVSPTISILIGSILNTVSIIFLSYI